MKSRKSNTNKNYPVQMKEAMVTSLRSSLVAVVVSE